MRAAIDDALEQLHRHVAGGLALADLPPLRPQPAGNPGVVEPNVDAHAYHRAARRLATAAVRLLVAEPPTG